MAVLRNFTFVLLAVAVLARNSECRSTQADATQDIDYSSDDELVSTGLVPEEAMQKDARDDWQADDGDDADEEDDTVVSQTIVSKPLRITARVGETVWLPCDITNSSDTSIEVVAWQHGDVKLLQGTHTFVSTIDGGSKIIHHSNWTIQIPSVTDADSGEYTCLLLSDQTQPRITHTLKVVSGSRRPSIKKMEAEPSRRVVEGSPVAITCVTEGYPRPTLIWSKIDGDSTENKRLGSADGVRFERDSLVIDRAERRHQGEYYCMADNGVDKPVISSLKIQVVGKPAVHVHKALVNAAVGVEAVLGCTVHFEPRSTLTWMKDGKEIVQSGDVFIEEEYPTINLRIPVVKEKDFGTYTCVATNQYGVHNRSAALVEEPVVEEISVGAGELVWRVHSHLPLKQVVLDVRNVDTEKQFSSQVTVSTQPTEENHVHVARFPLSELPTAHSYEARARAENARGWSAHTDSVVFRGAFEEDNPESIQAAGVGASISSNVSDAGELKSLALSTIVLCLLSRLVRY